MLRRMRRRLCGLAVILALGATAGNTEAAEPDSTHSQSATLPSRAPLADQLSPWLAAVVGSIGSTAYLIALWVGLVGRGDGKERVLIHFRKLWFLKVPLFVGGGGAVAMVFQLPEGKLIPVQAFIIGCTWPAVVSNYLSGRQSGEGEAEALQTLQKQQDAEKLQALVEAVPQPRAPVPGTDEELDQLMAILSGSADSSRGEPPGGSSGQDEGAGTPGKGGKA